MNQPCLTGLRHQARNITAYGLMALLPPSLLRNHDYQITLKSLTEYSAIAMTCGSPMNPDTDSGASCDNLTEVTNFPYANSWNTIRVG